MRMQAVSDVSKCMSLNRALQYCGMSKHSWYYTKKPRDMAIIWPHEFARFQDAEVVLAKAFEDYNKDRIHSALGYLTPDEFIGKMEVENR